MRSKSWRLRQGVIEYCPPLVREAITNFSRVKWKENLALQMQAKGQGQEPWRATPEWHHRPTVLRGVRSFAGFLASLSDHIPMHERTGVDSLCLIDLLFVHNTCSTLCACTIGYGIFRHVYHGKHVKAPWVLVKNANAMQHHMQK